MYFIHMELEDCLVIKCVGNGKFRHFLGRSPVFPKAWACLSDLEKNFFINKREDSERGNPTSKNKHQKLLSNPQ